MKYLPILLLIGTARIASAILFDTTSDPSYNSTAPTGEFLNSGWQFQGSNGVPIAPQYALSAQHLGLHAGDSFWFNNTRYNITASYDDPAGGDLRILKIDGTFSAYAPLYTGTQEVGKQILLFGAGAPKGQAVLDGNGIERGWLWGNGSWGTLRWGLNTITAVVDGAGYGHNFLGAEFNHSAGPNEAMLSGGDSGYGAFINDNGTWKLVGINSYVDGPYSTQSNLAGAFNAALYAQNGYYGDYWTGIAPMTGPGMLYVSRVSTSTEWIQSITAIPEPSTFLLLLLAGTAIAAKKVRKPTP